MAYASDQQASGLTAAGAPTGADLLVIQPGATGDLKKITLDSLFAAFPSPIIIKNNYLRMDSAGTPYAALGRGTSAFSATMGLALAQQTSIEWTNNNSTEEGFDVGIRRIAPGVLAINQTSSARGWLLQNGRAYKTADESVTSSTALQDDDHLTVTLKAGRKYAFRFYLLPNTTAAGGLKAAFGGTATHTNILAAATVHFDDGTIGAQQITAAGAEAPLSSAAGATVAVIEGVTEVNAAGTFLLQWAQQSSNGTATTLQRGSYLEVIDLG